MFVIFSDDDTLKLLADSKPPCWLAAYVHP